MLSFVRSRFTWNSIMLFIAPLLKGYKLFILGLLTTEIVWACGISLRAYMIKLIIDKLEHASDMTYLSRYLMIPILLYLLLSVIHTFIFRVSDYLYARMMPYLRKDIIMKCFKETQLQSYSYFQEHFGGTLATRISETADAIEYIINLSIYKFFAHILAFTIACITLGALVHSSFAKILVISSAISITISYWLARRPYKIAQQYMEAYTILIGKMVDSISNMLAILLFARRRYEFELIEKQANEEALKSSQLQFTVLTNQLVSSLFLTGLTSGCLFYLIYLRQRGLVTIGDFALVLTVTVSICEALQNMGRDFLKFAENVGKCSQTLDLITNCCRIDDSPDAQALVVTKGEVIFDRVSFSYKKGLPLFNSLSVNLASGQKVGLIGYSGSGKTTFINLILRLYEKQDGKILIDGQEISSVTQDSLHEAISFVPQEPILFNRTILENISYGKPSAAKREIIDAARKAYAHEFIENLPLEYNTVVGERGMNLSGGQRQRIVIARALLKDTRIFILDEITASLDPANEYYVQKSIRKNMQGKTVLIIAHHLETLLNMDRILVFDKGSIVGDGIHAELIKTHKVYQDLWSKQFKYSPLNRAKNTANSYKNYRNAS